MKFVERKTEFVSKKTFVQNTNNSRVAFHVSFGDSMGGMCVKGAENEEANAVGADLKMTSLLKCNYKSSYHIFKK